MFDLDVTSITNATDVDTALNLSQLEKVTFDLNHLFFISFLGVMRSAFNKAFITTLSFKEKHTRTHPYTPVQLSFYF